MSGRTGRWRCRCRSRASRRMPPQAGWRAFSPGAGRARSVRAEVRSAPGDKPSPSSQRTPSRPVPRFRTKMRFDDMEDGPRCRLTVRPCRGALSPRSRSCSLSCRPPSRAAASRYRLRRDQPFRLPGRDQPRLRRPGRAAGALQLRRLERALAADRQRRAGGSLHQRRRGPDGPCRPERRHRREHPGRRS